MAFLSRPQSLVLVAASVIAWLVWGRRGTRAWQGVAALTLLPIAALVLHTLWTSSVGEPFLREFSRSSVLNRIPRDIAGLAGQTVVMASFYIGFFVLPLAPLILSGWSQLRSPTHQKMAIGVGTALLVVGIASTFQGNGPFDGHTWITPSGLGAVDRSHLGHRPLLIPFAGWALLGFLFLTVTYLLFVTVLRPRRRLPMTQRAFVLIGIAGFSSAVFLSSLALQQRVFDRYWLPVIPLLLALAASQARATRLRISIVSVLVLATAVFSTVGTFDSFNTYQAVVDFADDSITSGIDPLAFDGGAAWSALTFGLSDDTPLYIQERGGPFWMQFYAIESYPEYGVALEALDGYEILEQREYRSVLHHQVTYVYLVRRERGLLYFFRVEDF